MSMPTDTKRRTPFSPAVASVFSEEPKVPSLAKFLSVFSTNIARANQDDPAWISSMSEPCQLPMSAHALVDHLLLVIVADTPDEIRKVVKRVWKRVTPEMCQKISKRVHS